MFDLVFQILLVVVVAASVAAPFYVLFFHKRVLTRRAAHLDLTDPLPNRGADVPLLYAMTSQNGPLGYSYAHNALNPALTLFDHRLEVRMYFRKRPFNYSEIERVVTVYGEGSNQMTFTLADSLQTLAIRMVYESDCQLVREFLARQGIQVQAEF